MPIIDADAHFEPAHGWIESAGDLASRLPQRFPDDDPRFELNTPEMYAFFVTDDLLRGVEPGKRMGMDRLPTAAMRAMYSGEPIDGWGYEGASMNRELLDPGTRLAWLDEQGIACQNVITGTGYTLARVISDPELGQDTLEALNTWMSDAVAGVEDRLMPVTCLRFDDLDWVVRELTRMRKRGSRTFLVSSEPVNGSPRTTRTSTRCGRRPRISA